MRSKGLKTFLQQTLIPIKGPALCVLLPKSPPGMVVQNSFYIPEHYAHEYREDMLRDAGVAGTVSCFAIFGEKRKLSETISLIAGFEQGALLPLLARLAVYIAHHGMRSAEEDPVQKDLVKAGIQYGCQVGLSPSREFRRLKWKDVFLVGPDLINGAIALALAEAPLNGSGIDPNVEIGKLAFLLLSLSDHVFDDADTPDWNDKHYHILRQNLIQSPQLGTLGTFSARIHRFHTIYSKVLERISPDLRKKADTYLTEKIGVNFETLNRLLFPINVPWLTVKDFRQNAIIDERYGNGNSIGVDIQKLLSRLSLTPLAYREKIKEVQAKYGTLGFKSSRILLLFTQYPFLEFNKGAYLLLAPHLILRSIELSVRGAFIDAKHKPIEDFYGPLGEEFEKFGNKLFERKIRVSTKGLFQGLVLNPKDKNGNEICDALIEAPEGVIVIESKYKPPPIGALDIANPDTKEIKTWVENSFSISPEEAKSQNRRPGALWQLRVAALKLNRESLNYKPNSIVPVILISEEILFTKNLYEILDKEILDKKIFEGLENIQPLLVITIGELETITSYELAGTKWTIFKIFFEKSTKSNARQTNWAKFGELLNLKYVRSEEETKTFTALVEETKSYFL